MRNPPRNRHGDFLDHRSRRLRRHRQIPSAQEHSQFPVTAASGSNSPVVVLPRHRVAGGDTDNRARARSPLVEQLHAGQDVAAAPLRKGMSGAPISLVR